MEIRPATPADVTQFSEIDGTIESTHYLHLDRTGEGVAVGWKSELRPLREKLIAAAPLHDDDAFLARQIALTTEDGLALYAVHDDQPAALLVAQLDHRYSVVRLLDLRVDSDFRRQGLATVLIYQLIEWARGLDGVRAIAADTVTSNAPANALLVKAGFELSGLDTRRHSNHDLVKEAATLLWYFELTH